jgi:hypothetical protein
MNEQVQQLDEEEVELRELTEEELDLVGGGRKKVGGGRTPN